MSVNDRWHKSYPQPGDPQCREHKMALTADHGKGDRWQVRWRDEDGEQRARNFAKKTGKNPDQHADAFDAKVQKTLDDGSYISPASANTTLKDFAETWRQHRTHDVSTAANVERRLRLHVYPADDTPRRTPTGALAIGHLPLRELEKRPSVLQAWISGIRLAPSSALLVIGDVSAVLSAAIDDGLINRNPLNAKSIQRPVPDEHKVTPWTLETVEGMAEALPDWCAVLPYLGAGTGMRQGEMFGCDAEQDIDFLRRVVHVRRQIRIVDNVLCFAPVKNDKEHDVPLADSLAPHLSEHMRLHPPVAVTLPWKEPGGEPVTRRLLLARPGGLPAHRTYFNRECWHRAQVAAGVVPPPPPGGRRTPARDQGVHVLRHTAASAWLSAGMDIAAVAEWLGDTVKTVHDTYAHMMPGADDRGRRAMDAFFTGRVDQPGSARNVHA